MRRSPARWTAGELVARICRVELPYPTLVEARRRGNSGMTECVGAGSVDRLQASGEHRVHALEGHRHRVAQVLPASGDQVRGVLGVRLRVRAEAAEFVRKLPRLLLDSPAGRVRGAPETSNGSWVSR